MHKKLDMSLYGMGLHALWAEKQQFFSLLNPVILWTITDWGVEKIYLDENYQTEQGKSFSIKQNIHSSKAKCKHLIL